MKPNDQYAGFVEMLRSPAMAHYEYDADQGAILQQAADILEAVLAERDALKAVVEIYEKKLSGIEDEIRLAVQSAIAAIRPHIEASERERCARIAEGSFLFDVETWLNSTKKEMTTHLGNAIAAAIRSGE